MIGLECGLPTRRERLRNRQFVFIRLHPFSQFRATDSSSPRSDCVPGTGLLLYFGCCHIMHTCMVQDTNLQDVKRTVTLFRGDIQSRRGDSCHMENPADHLVKMPSFYHTDHRNNMDLGISMGGCFSVFKTRATTGKNCQSFQTSRKPSNAR